MDPRPCSATQPTCIHGFVRIYKQSDFTEVSKTTSRAVLFTSRSLCSVHGEASTYSPQWFGALDVRVDVIAQPDLVSAQANQQSTYQCFFTAAILAPYHIKLTKKKRIRQREAVGSTTERVRGAAKIQIPPTK